NGIFEELGIVERQRVDLLGVGAEIGDLVHDAHEVLLGQGVAMSPCRPSAVPEASWSRGVLQPDERKPPVIADIGPYDKRSTAELRQRAYCEEYAGEHPDEYLRRTTRSPTHQLSLTPIEGSAGT